MYPASGGKIKLQLDALWIADEELDAFIPRHNGLAKRDIAIMQPPSDRIYIVRFKCDMIQFASARALNLLSMFFLYQMNDRVVI